MIDHIWRERLALSDRLMCVAKCDPTLFSASVPAGVAAPEGDERGEAAAQSAAPGVTGMRRAT